MYTPETNITLIQTVVKKLKQKFKCRKGKDIALLDSRIYCRATTNKVVLMQA